MRLTILVVCLIQTIKQTALAQTGTIPPSGKGGAIYLTWGYHRNAYSTSTLHLKDHSSDNYDFTLYHAKAKDQPDMHNLLRTPLTVPQYVFRLGYFFNNKKDLGIEFSWDHLKYVVTDNQMMHLKGWIHENYFDKDTLVTPDLVHFEHTNGNNYAIVSLVKRNTFFQPANGRHKLSGLYTAGAGVLIPKTDSRVLGNRNDGPFRYSGIVVAASAGLRYEFFKYFYVEPSVKGAFANYTNAKVYLQGRAKHHFFSVQYVFAAGINFPLGD
jgi:hypothetical protein